MRIHRIFNCVKNFLKSRSRVFKWEKAIEHRSRRGRRWKITELLNTALIGMILMCKSMLRVEQVSGILGKIGKKLGIEGRVPDSTLEPTALPIGVISIDGKKVWSGKYKANKYCKEIKSGRF